MKGFCRAIIPCALLLWAASAFAQEVTISVSPKSLFALDERLFGQMMERAAFGEPGPEGGLIPGTHKLQPSVVEKLRASRITVMRFPGGTDADRSDWLDLIDNAPGRTGKRPASITIAGGSITTGFGYDEFLQLCEQLKAQPLLVVNFQDGLLGRMPLADGVRRAAGLVAYCNASVDDPKLSKDLVYFAEARVLNGREKPYRVRVFQIGNETWGAWNQMKDLGMSPEESTKHYVDCLATYIDAMRAVDPTIEIIADAPPADRLIPAIKARLGDKVNYIVGEHAYAPFGSYRDIKKDGKPVPAESLTAEETWNAWVSMPWFDHETGVSILQHGMWDAVRASGYKAACTEWNSNTWSNADTPKLAIESSYARGIAAAGIMQALMRSGDVVKIATKSMCVGIGWKQLASVWADAQGRRPAYLLPTGSTLAFYSRHHGPEMLEIKTRNVPRFSQPYSLAGHSAPGTPVAAIDAIATGDNSRVFVHIINRKFAEDVPVTIDLSAFGAVGAKATLHLYTGRLNDDPKDGEGDEIVTFANRSLKPGGKTLRVTIPKRSISIIEIPATR